MRDDLLHQMMWEALQEWAKLPFEEQHAEMVRRGVIDDQGRVLLRMPEPPPNGNGQDQSTAHGEGLPDNSTLSEKP